MSKRARAGELQTLVYFRRVIRGADNEGYPRTESEEPVFICGGAGRELPVHCKWVNAHGTEVFSAMQLQLREPATLTMRFSPKIDSTLLVYRRGDPRPYEIVSMNNVEDRGKWLEIKVQRKGAAR
ncbi:MAG: head-tail adaptor protein [Oscillospiraceae bacterium]|nr:head-tail adaptor protein [Oscillospiraceae bacterium]